MVVGLIGTVMGFSSIMIGLYIGGYWATGCHSVYENAIDHLGSKTPYLFPHKTVPNPPNKGCKAEQIWIIVRHGSRLPGQEIISDIHTKLPVFRDEIVKNHEEGRGSLCTDSLEQIKSWTPNPGFKESQEKWLIPQGEVEVDGIARRYKDRYPELFNSTYNNNAVKFKYTKTQRAEASAKVFAKALFPDNHKDVSYPTPVKADPIIRFYKSCEKWQQEVDDNPETYKEVQRFENSDPFQSTLQNIQQRLGFQRNMSVAEIYLVYLTCSFETAWHPEKLSNWCTIFDENDIRVLEYRSDIKFYWVDGYGYELTYKQACAPVKDVLEHFKDRIDKPAESPNIVAYFTHSGTLLKFVSRLGLFKDDIPLLSDNYHKHSNRKWKTGKIDKFATNLAFVLFKCQQEYKVGTYFQEKPVIIEACQDYFCTFEKFQSNLAKTIEDCDVKSMCNVQ